jgi:hypothetical protein
MKSWVRLALVTVSVGGGFAGFAATLAALFDSQGDKVVASIFRIVFLALYAYITASGLMFVHNPRLVRPLALALALQIPWFSSPLLVYKLAAGPAALIGVVSPAEAGKLLVIHWQLLLAATWRFELFQGARWEVSVNLFALGLFVLLRRADGKDNSTGLAPPTSDPAAPTSISTSGATTST